ncbi:MULTISPECIES: hypothetical protein [unclassified Microcoleus]|uniref:hypothetical protein n=1 Tax=unclassified Microcoleus TaxID=2642155 RepID=UPI002FD2EE96
MEQAQKPVHLAFTQQTNSLPPQAGCLFRVIDVQNAPVLLSYGGGKKSKKIVAAWGWYISEFC